MRRETDAGEGDEHTEASTLPLMAVDENVRAVPGATVPVLVMESVGLAR